MTQQSENYANDVMERIAENIFPYLGNRPIAEITPPELLAVLRKIEIRGAVDQVHRVRGIRSLIFRYAIATSRAERDTAADLRGALKSRTVTPRATITDPEIIGGLLRAIDNFTGTYIIFSYGGEAALYMTVGDPRYCSDGSFWGTVRGELDTADRWAFRNALFITVIEHYCHMLLLLTQHHYIALKFIYLLIILIKLYM